MRKPRVRKMAEFLWIAIVGSRIVRFRDWRSAFEFAVDQVS